MGFRRRTTRPRRCRWSNGDCPPKMEKKVIRVVTQRMYYCGSFGLVPSQCCAVTHMGRDLGLDDYAMSCYYVQADSPHKRYSRSPSPWEEKSRSRTRSRSRSRSRSWPRHKARSRSRSRSRSGSRSRSHGRSEAGNPGNTLYVTGLSTRVTERDLEDHFSKEGKVKSVFLVVEPRSRVSRGFAFITMDSVEGANRCIKHLNQSILEGRYITVERSRRKRPRTPTPGHYLGLKSSRGDGYRGDRGRYRGGSSRDDHGYRKSPRRSPYRGGREYSPRRSPYGGRSRRETSGSYSPYRSPERNYAYGSRLN